MPGKTASSSPRGVTNETSMAPARARRVFRFGLVPRIVSLVAVTALVTGVAVGVAGVHNSRDSLHAQILTDSQAEADLTARFTERYVAIAQEALQKIAALPGFAQSVRSGAIADSGPALETLRNLTPQFENLTIYDVDGNRLATARAILPAVNVKGQDWFDGAVSTRAPHLGGGYLGLNTGTPVAPYAIPLLDADGSVAGVLLGSISLGQLTQALAFANEGVDARVILVDSRGGGKILSHPDPSLILQPVSAGATFKAALVLDQRAAMATEDASGESVLLAVSPISNLSWSVVAEKSGASTFTLLGRVSNDMLVLGGPLVLLACLISGLVAMQIVRPLISLRKAAYAVAAGAPGRRLNLTQNDEVGDLGRTFDLMSQALDDRSADLQRAHNELEGRVRDRTAELARSEERFRSLIEKSHDGISLLNAEGIPIYSSPASEHILGFTHAELVNLTGNGLVHPDDAEARRAAHERMIATPGGVAEVTCRMRHRDGSWRWLEITYTNFLEDPAVRSVVVNFRDVTARRELEAEMETIMTDLRRSNAELEQFAYVASHDLQEPLRMISNYTQLLARRYSSKLGEDADTFIGFAVEGAGRMQQLINDLLEFSRVGTKGKDLAPIESQTVLDLALRNLETAIEEADARVEVEGELPPVYGDDGQLTQVFQNLIANAIKFHGAGPPVVRVSSEREGAYWRFAVSDNGIGIEPQYSDRVFVIFQRLHTREEYAGTGIGLALCKRIIERHGGRIWLDSEPGKGATFYFTLQAATQRSAGKPALAERAA